MPEQLAVRRIEGADEAALLLVLSVVSVATAESLYHFAADHDGAAGISVAPANIGDYCIPRDFSGACVESDEMRVGRRGKNLVLIDGEVAHRARSAALLALGP